MDLYPRFRNVEHPHVLNLEIPAGSSNMRASAETGKDPATTHPPNTSSCVDLQRHSIRL